jgi:multidrug efflux pump subunit AcrA (membrane-fusion protein)
MRIASLFIILMTGVPAAAQSSQPFLACARIVADAERLACFDKATAALSAEAARITAEREAESARLRQAEAAAAAAAQEAERRARFGAEGLGAAPDGSRLTELDATVAETFLDRARLLVFLLDNGQVWRQTDGTFKSLVQPGTQVRVKRTAMGGYMLVIPSKGRTVPVRRIR